MPTNEFMIESAIFENANYCLASSFDGLWNLGLIDWNVCVECDAIKLFRIY